MKLGRLFSLCALSVAFSLPASAQSSSTNAKPREAQAEEKPERVIPGITIERKDGDGLLGIEIVDNNFKLTFYNQDKEPVQADRPRALLRWSVRYKSADERLVLNKGGDGTYLTSLRVIRPPHYFRLYITLLGDDDDKEGESEPVTYIINYN